MSMLPAVRVKICGLTRREDAELAADLGAAYLGFVFAPSPRQAEPDRLRGWLPSWRAARPGLRVVGVFVPPLPVGLDRLTDELGLDLIQVHQRTGAHPVGSAGANAGALPAAGAEGTLPAGNRHPWICAVRPEGLPRIEAGPGPGGVGPASARTFASNAGRVDRVAFAPGGSPSDRLDAAVLPPFAWLVDTPSTTQAGGTGRSFDWSLVPGPPRPYRLFLAGGLAADNVGVAIRAVQPYAVDVSSRLEAEPGRKDPDKLREFFRAVVAVAHLGLSEAPRAPVAEAQGGPGRVGEE